MKIDRIQPAKFGAKVIIKGIDNKNHPYLYNEILGLTREYKIPATFRTPEIELPSVTKDILKKLKELNINFNSK